MKRSLLILRAAVTVLVLAGHVMPPLHAGDAYRLPDARVAVAYEFRMATEGGLPPLKWKIGEDPLPAGLELAGDGTLRGVPTSPRAQAYEFELEVYDSSQPPQTSRQRFALLVQAAPLRIKVGGVPTLKIVPPERKEEATAVPDQGTSGASGVKEKKEKAKKQKKSKQAPGEEAKDQNATDEFQPLVGPTLDAPSVVYEYEKGKTAQIVYSRFKGRLPRDTRRFAFLINGVGQDLRIQFDKNCQKPSPPSSPSLVIAIPEGWFEKCLTDDNRPTLPVILGGGKRGELKFSNSTDTEDAKKWADFVLDLPGNFIAENTEVQVLAWFSDDKDEKPLSAGVKATPQARSVGTLGTYRYRFIGGVEQSVSRANDTEPATFGFLNAYFESPIAIPSLVRHRASVDDFAKRARLFGDLRLTSIDRISLDSKIVAKDQFQKLFKKHAIEFLGGLFLPLNVHSEEDPAYPPRYVSGPVFVGGFITPTTAANDDEQLILQKSPSRFLGQFYGGWRFNMFFSRSSSPDSRPSYYNQAYLDVLYGRNKANAPHFHGGQLRLDGFFPLPWTEGVLYLYGSAVLTLGRRPEVATDRRLKIQQDVSHLRELLQASGTKPEDLPKLDLSRSEEDFFLGRDTYRMAVGIELLNLFRKLRGTAYQYVLPGGSLTR